MDQGISSLVTGLSQSINGYLGQQQQAQNQEQIENAKQTSEASRQLTLEQAKNTDALNKGEALENYKVGLQDKLTPDMAEKALPGYGAKMVQDYNTSNPNSPLKLKDGLDYLDKAHKMLNPDDSKADNHQDALEKQATDRLSQIRGDSSIQRTELQRDAAGQAYDTVAKASSENRPLTQLEQTDLIAQLWKARSGNSPSDQDMKQMQDQTGKRDFNHLVTYVTGNPSLVGASTQDTLANLKQFIVSTGLKADQQHEGYMAPRLIKPTGLDDDRWNHISSVARGINFSSQKSISDKTYESNSPSADTSGWSIKKVQ